MNNSDLNCMAGRRGLREQCKTLHIWGSISLTHSLCLSLVLLHTHTTPRAFLLRIFLMSFLVLQFAVDVLKVEHIIVCGHFDCGGIRAALEPRDAGTVGLWLSHVRDVHRMHIDELREIKDAEVRCSFFCCCN